MRRGNSPIGRFGYWMVVFATVALSRNAWGGKKIFVGKSPPPSPVSMNDINHQSFDVLLHKYVDKNGMVDYRRWKASPKDLAALDEYLDHLSTADPKKQATREARLAYWINAYNSVTLRGMLDVYPTTSIRKHTATIYGYNIWKDLLLRLGNGTSISLDDIEHQRLRKMSEPRIHFAIVCASMSCPRLLDEAYVASRIDDQLESNSRDFFSRRQNFEQRDGRFYLSKLLDWYGSDFGSDLSAQLKAYAQWLPTESTRQQAVGGSVGVRYLAYDWSINEQPRKKTANQGQ